MDFFDSGALATSAYLVALPSGVHQLCIPFMHDWALLIILLMVLISVLGGQRVTGLFKEHQEAGWSRLS